MLSLRSVTKRFGALTALDGVSLDIARGEFFGLLGPNGAGKSTIMSLICGLRAPDSGSLTLDGQPLTAANSTARLSLGLVPQHVALYPELSADQNLRIFGQLYRLCGADLRARIDAALEAVQLADRRREPVKNFSGGMARRLNLAAALLHRPKLLLCDEPTVGVDPQSRNAIFEYLERLNRDGLTVIYSTHYMEEATRLCSRIGIIDHGKIPALGTLDELLTQLPFEEEIRFPATPATAALAAQLPAHGEREESREFEIRARAEAVRAVGGGEFAERDELRGEGRGGGGGGEANFLLEGELREEFVEGAEGVEFAVVDDADARTEARGLLHVVRGVDDGEALAVEALEVFEDGVARMRIDADGGLVAEEKFRAMEEGGGEIEAAGHAAGEIFHGLAAAIGELHGFEGGVDAGAEIGAAEAVELAEDAEVLIGGEFGVERDVLRDETEREARGGVGGGERLAVERERAGVGRAEAADERHRGGLAGAVGAEQAEELAAGDVERHAVERGERAEALGDRAK